MPCPLSTCPMCLTKNVLLQDSHVLPKWSYRPLHDPGSANPNPVVIHRGRWSQKSQQVHEYMLCLGCEARIARGDSYVATIACKRGKFPGLGLIGPLIAETNQVQYVEPGQLDAQLLAYFAASVVWRGHMARQITDCNLGPYADAFREYLLGQRKFPGQSAARVYMVRADRPKWEQVTDLISMPQSGRTQHIGNRRRPPRYSHEFAICGLYFTVQTGVSSAEIDVGLTSFAPSVGLVSRAQYFSWVAPMLDELQPCGTP
jgi:hypothetical protein